MMGVLDFCREKIAGMVSRRHFPVDMSRPIGSGHFVVLDTELTGLDRHADSIVSIGAVRMTGGRIELGDAFYRLISPSTELTADSIVIHEITPSEVFGKPLIEQILIELVGYCRDALVVGHFISIDMDFINREMRRVYETNMKNHVLDTCTIYEWMRENDRDFDSRYGGAQEEVNLFALAKKLGVPVSGAHNALSDAFMTAQLFQRFLRLLPNMGVKTIGDLVRIGRA